MAHVYVYSSNSAGGSLSSFTLPIPFKSGGTNLVSIPVTEEYGTGLGTRAIVQGYTYDGGNTVVGFWSNNLGTNGQPIRYTCTIIYEID